MWLGEALWLTLAVYGLAAVAETLHGAFLIVKYLGAAYLLYLAWRIWSAPIAVAPDRPAPRAGGFRMFLASLAVLDDQGISAGVARSRALGAPSRSGVAHGFSRSDGLAKPIVATIGQRLLNVIQRNGPAEAQSSLIEFLR